MADDPIDSMLAQYGYGYADPRLGMSGGDRIDYGTQHILSGMDAQKSAKESEYYNALARLFMTAMAPVAVLHGQSRNFPEALRRHVAQERKEGNPLMGPFSMPAAGLTYGTSTALGINELLNGNPWLGGGLTAMNAFSGIVNAQKHGASTARILEHLNRTEPKTRTLY